MPPLYPQHAFPGSHTPSPHRDWTRLPGTVDKGMHVCEDTLRAALTPSVGPLVGGLSSKSVKDCRLSATAKPTIRSVGATGVTGGRVEGATCDATVNWGHVERSAIHAARNEGRVSGKNARKRAKRAAQNAAA